MEIALGFFQNLLCMIQISLFLTVVAIAFLSLTLLFSCYDVTPKEIEVEKRRIKKLLVAAFCLAILSCIPGIDDLWKVRIGLLKLQLASPENVQKSVDEISRIAEKLECKYLGCEKNQKSPEEK